MTEPLFWIDGESFEVQVTALQREFAILQATEPCVTMDGICHREPLGSYCHYKMTVAAHRDPGELERFWEKVSQPVESFGCVFPYGQQTLTQEMYVESGSQALLDAKGENRWGSITLRFLGKAPRVSG